MNARIYELNPYQPGKPLGELTRELGVSNAIKLASNENPRGPSQRVVDAIQAELHELSRYPDGTGFSLKGQLSEHLGVEPNRITLGNGSNDVLELAARVALSPESNGIVDEHCFVVYPLAITASQGRTRVVPSKSWGHDLQAMLAAVDASTRILFIANPNNPTGTWLNEVDLRAFLEQVPRRIWVVLDEAYFEYARGEPGYPNGVELAREFENLIVTRTFSKVYGLAGLRIGYGISNPSFADLMNRVRQPFNANSLALRAAEVALGDVDYVTESRRINEAGYEALTTGLTRLGFEYIPSIGNFISFRVGQNTSQVYEAMLRAGVVVRPLANYGMAEYLRVTIGLEEENARFLSTLAVCS